MSDILDLHLEKIIHVKAKKINNSSQSKKCVYKDFYLNQQNVRFSYLKNLIEHIFHIENDFTINYEKEDVYIPLTSDLDLNIAIFESPKAYLALAIELQPLHSDIEDWDIICPADISKTKYELSPCSYDKKSFAYSLINQVENAMLKISRALSFDVIDDKWKPPLDEATFINFLDNEGRVMNHRRLHLSIFQSGVDPEMRYIIWKHLLNVYPHGMTLTERESYMNSKSEEYYQLRYSWQYLIQRGTLPDMLQDVTNLVRKDVNRTDSCEKFYSTSDNGDNVRAMFNILTTYAVNHPSISYCQGMSDLLSPILYIMKKESHAYICFCGLMERLQSNFRSDGRSIRKKFNHLRKLIYFFDQDFYFYLQQQDALNLLFCYRWLLLEMKREFPYNDMLNMLEVLWSSIPPRPPKEELDLYETRFPTTEICNTLKEKLNIKNNFSFRDDYFNLSIEESSGDSLLSNNNSDCKELSQSINRRTFPIDIRNNQSTCIKSSYAQDATEFFDNECFYSATDVHLTNWLQDKYLQHVHHPQDCSHSFKSQMTQRKRRYSSDSNYSTLSDEYSEKFEESSSEGLNMVENLNTHRTLSESTSSSDCDVFYEAQDVDQYENINGNSVDFTEEEEDYQIESCYHQINHQKKDILPPPHILGDGNPFLLFLCLALIEQNRDEILKMKLDLNGLGIFFDKKRKKYKLPKILQTAQSLFKEYLNLGWENQISEP